MKLPKKPKEKKFPKRPKTTASYEVWQRYYNRCEEVRKENQKALKEWDKKVKDLKHKEAQKKKLIEKSKTLSRI